MPLRALVAVIVTTVVMLVPRAWADTAWERYKARFMMPDGRIIDTAQWQCVAYGRSGLRHAPGGGE